MNALKTLPKVDKCLSNPLFEGCNPTLVMKIARAKIEEIRHGLIQKEIEHVDEEALSEYPSCGGETRDTA